MFTNERYWRLVESDPRDMTRDQKILFWWLVGLLPRMAEGGGIVAPDPAPLSEDQIIEVYEKVLPAPDKPLDSQMSYMDEFWTYTGQTVVIASQNGPVITIREGNIEVEES